MHPCFSVGVLVRHTLNDGQAGQTNFPIIEAEVSERYVDHSRRVITRKKRQSDDDIDSVRCPDPVRGVEVDGNVKGHS